MTYDLTDDQINKLASIDATLRDLVEKEGLRIHRSDPSEDNPEWDWRLPLMYKGEKAYLYLSVRLKEDLQYRVHGGGSSSNNSDFIHIKQVYTDDLIVAQNMFEVYMQCAIDNHVPVDLMIEQNVWKEVGGGVPASMKDAKVVFSAVGMYRLHLGREFLQVYKPTENEISVLYEGDLLEERVRVLNRRIVNVDTFLAKHRSYRENMSPEDFLNSIFDRPRPKRFTYHNIKRFEKQLKQLPWQKDLQAIYNGNGEFRTGFYQK